MSFKIIFFVVLFIFIYFLLCCYIGYNGWIWLKSTFLKGRGKKVYILLIVFLSFSIPLAQMVPWSFLKWISGYWMAVVGYCLLLIPVANIIFLLFKKRGVFWIGNGVIVIFSLIFIIGSFNAWNPVVRNYEITMSQSSESSNVKIMLVSDLHLGAIIGEYHLQKLIDLSQQVKPDIILLAGDIIDDHVEPFQKEHMGDILTELQAPLGVYAISGNHDVYGNDLAKLEKELDNAGIQFLSDESVLIFDQFYVVGRKDLAEGKRKSIETLIQRLDQTKPILMLDHQPTELDLAQQAGVDLLLSGHTHHGQLAPANLVTGLLYENDGGDLEKETLHSFVSTGFGTWGPPLRIGSQSEVMVINLRY